jgi:ABC-type Mn2+/Zn2+ transport system ATPase subunit
LLLARGLKLGYGGAAAVEGLDLSYGKREGALGLRGPNGSGKTSFLKACVGLLRPLDGSVSVLGTDSRERGFRSILHRVGYLPQHRHLGSLRMSARELAATGRDASRGIFRFARREDEKAADAALERLGLLSLADRAVQELSGGQYQRVLLARALAADPELILLDEPGSHLDGESREVVISLIREIAAEGKIGLVMVSHDKALLSLCSRFVDFKGSGAPAPEEEEADA